MTNIRMLSTLLVLTTSICAFAGSSLDKKTIAAFESSSFYKKHAPARKNSWKLKSGFTNNSYIFNDPDTPSNPFPSLSVELTSNGVNIVEIGIMWSPYDSKVKITPKKEEQIRDLLAFWGGSNVYGQVLKYAKSQQSKNYPGGSGSAPRKVIGPITVHCGQTAGDLWIGWE